MQAPGPPGCWSPAVQYGWMPPPDEAATADETSQLIAMMNERDEDSLQEIAYWNAGPPSYRWNQIAVGAIDKRGIPGTSASRVLALVHAAVYDATIDRKSTRLNSSHVK